MLFSGNVSTMGAWRLYSDSWVDFSSVPHWKQQQQRLQRLLQRTLPAAISTKICLNHHDILVCSQNNNVFFKNLFIQIKGWSWTPSWNGTGAHVKWVSSFFQKAVGSGGIRTHDSKEAGAWNQRLGPLGHPTPYFACKQGKIIPNKHFLPPLCWHGCQGYL